MPIALGWRVRSWESVVVAVSGSAESPVVLHRDRVSLIDDPSLREPFHAAAAAASADAPAIIDSAGRLAAAKAAATIAALAGSLGRIGAVGLVGGNRKLPELSRILTKHALLHAADRDLYENAILAGAASKALPVATISATGKLFTEASEILGFAVEPCLASIGKAIGPPWQKEYREATTAALLALASA